MEGDTDSCLLDHAKGIINTFKAFYVCEPSLTQPFPSSHTVSHHIGYVKRLLNK